MRKCPKCNSLVDDERTECCGVPLEGAGTPDPTSSTASPVVSSAATVALSADQLKELNAQASQGKPIETPPVARTTAAVSEPSARPIYRGGVAASNPAARRAYVLGLLSLIPLFPIALAAFVTGIVALGNASRIPGSPGRGRAWFGTLSGALFGVLWTALTVSLFLP